VTADSGSPGEPIGIVEQPDGRLAVGALVPLGRLGGAALAVLAEAGQLVVTPWRGVLVTDLVPSAAAECLDALARAGLEVSAESRWAGVTACAGRPGCAKALGDVRHDAARATRFGDGLPVHWIGCERGCGSPAGPHVRVQATGAGYQVTAPGFQAAGTAEVGELVAAARRS
jgi:precorrin-3B synthase